MTPNDPQTTKRSVQTTTPFGGRKMTRRPIGLSVPYRKAKNMTKPINPKMTLAEFNDYVASEVHEAIYDDSEGRTIVVIRMLDLYALVNAVVRHAKEK